LLIQEARNQNFRLLAISLEIRYGVTSLQLIRASSKFEGIPLAWFCKHYNNTVNNSAYKQYKRYSWALQTLTFILQK